MMLNNMMENSNKSFNNILIITNIYIERNNIEHIYHIYIYIYIYIYILEHISYIHTYIHICI